MLMRQIYLRVPSDPEETVEELSCGLRKVGDRMRTNNLLKFNPDKTEVVVGSCPYVGSGEFVVLDVVTSHSS